MQDSQAQTLDSSKASLENLSKLITNTRATYKVYNNDVKVVDHVTQ